MLITDIDPLKAAEMYFEGEKSGFSEAEFTKNKEEKGLIYPSKLKDFLLRFGNLKINLNILIFWHPEHVQTVNVSCGGIKRKIFVFGEWKNRGIGIFADECGMEDPSVIFVGVEQAQDGESTLSFTETKYTLNNILAFSFTENLFFRSGGAVYMEEADIDTMVRHYSKKPQKGEKSFKQQIMTDKGRPCVYINFDEEEGRFVCLELDENYDIILVFDNKYK